MEEKKIEIPEDVIVLDIALMPSGLDAEKWINLMKNQGICLVDSFRGRAHNGPEPIRPYMLQSKRKLKYEVIENKDYKEKK